MKKGTFKKKTLVRSIEYAFSHRHNTKIRILMTMQFILSVIKISKEHNGIYKTQKVFMTLLRNHHFKRYVIDQFINFCQIFLEVDLFCLVYEFQQLEVENGFMGIRGVFEYFDGSIAIHQILVEERRIFLCFQEERSC